MDDIHKYMKAHYISAINVSAPSLHDSENKFSTITIMYNNGDEHSFRYKSKHGEDLNFSSYNSLFERFVKEDNFYNRKNKIKKICQNTMGYIM